MGMAGKADRQPVAGLTPPPPDAPRIRALGFEPSHGHAPCPFRFGVCLTLDRRYPGPLPSHTHTPPPPPEGCPSATSQAAGEDEEALAGPRGVDEPDLGARNHLLHLKGKRWAGAPMSACAWKRIIHVES